MIQGMEQLSQTIYTAAQVKELDRYASESFSISGNVLIERAGEAAFQLLLSQWPNSKRLLVLCGTGNNAGDGFVIARLAAEQEINVQVMQVGDINKLHGDALAAQQRLLGSGVVPHTYSTTQDLELSRYDVIIDAMLGTGVHGNVDGNYAEVINVLNSADTPVFSIDIPSGLNADTGMPQGLAVKANLTITYVGIKQGLITGDGPEYSGKVVFNDLKLPKALYDMCSPAGYQLDYEKLTRLLPRRLRNAHKGDFGHVVLIGGAPGMPGAIRLAGEAAARSGAGRVTIVTHPEHAATLNTSRPELICYGVEQVEEIFPLLALASVIGIGPGLGQSKWAQDLLVVAIESGLPLVVDADALNLLAESNQVYDNWILTPHPGEAGRLLGKSSSEIQRDRFSSVKEISEQFGGIAVLKGLGTLIKSKEGLPSVCPYGNPGMATGGMGDVLTGIIVGLIAQGLSNLQATELGVAIHSKASDEAAKVLGERGMLASDLMSGIRRLVNPKF